MLRTWTGEKRIEYLIVRLCTFILKNSRVLKAASLQRGKGDRGSVYDFYLDMGEPRRYSTYNGHSLSSAHFIRSIGINSATHSKAEWWKHRFFAVKMSFGISSNKSHFSASMRLVQLSHDSDKMPDPSPMKQCCQSQRRFSFSLIKHHSVLQTMRYIYTCWTCSQSFMTLPEYVTAAPRRTHLCIARSSGSPFARLKKLLKFREEW